MRPWAAAFHDDYQVALDAAGNVYVADSGNNALKVMPAGCKSSACVSTLLTNANGVGPLVLDPSGNVYVGMGSVVKKMPRSTPPTLSFANTPAGQISNDSPRHVTVRNIGNATLNISDLEYPFDFPEDINAPATECPVAGSLAAGHKCTLTIDFLPFPESVQAANTLLNEPLSLTDNNLNGASATQSVTLKGVETVTLAALTSPAANTVLPGPKVTFNWSGGSGGVTGYILRLGTSVGASNICTSGTITATGYTDQSADQRREDLCAPPNQLLVVRAVACRLHLHGLDYGGAHFSNTQFDSQRTQSHLQLEPFGWRFQLSPAAGNHSGRQQHLHLGQHDRYLRHTRQSAHQR